MAITPTSTPTASLITDSSLESLQQRFKLDPTLGIIQKNLPSTFVNASPAERKEYFVALSASRRAKAELKQLFKPLLGLRAFAEPLLVKALDDRFGPGLNVREDTLFYPTLLPSGATGPSTQLSLLESALHNFERKESLDGFFLSSAAILNARGEVHQKSIAPSEFADLCRHLNLGKKYQDHLYSVLEPDVAPGDTSDVARFNARAKFIAHDQAELELCAQIAAINTSISQHACSAIIALARHEVAPSFDGQLLWLKRLTMFGHEIPRVLLIEPRRTWAFNHVPIVLYIPGDPVCPLKEFSSMTELEDDLRGRLMDKRYQTFFAQLIGERKRAEFFAHLNRHLFPLAPVDGSLFTQGLWQYEADPQAKLVLDTDLLRENPFIRMHRQQLFLLKDNARFLAVPTEDEDAKSRQARLRSWLAVGMNILNVASFVVPQLAALMMAYTAVEMVGEVYQGLEDLSHDDLQEGLEHLESVAANLAFMALLAKAHAGAMPPEPPAMTSNAFVDSVIPVKLAGGQTRLWKPDLEPFQARVELPQGTSPDIQGIVDHDGKKYLNLDDRLYEVEYQNDLSQWTVKHPHEPYPFAPPLEHNGAGAFRYPGEQPEQWAKDKLFRRLGHSVSGLSEQSAQQILSVVDVDESLLRQVHRQNALPPGQLSDTVKRFQLDATLESFVEQPGNTRAAQFIRRYEASQVSSDPLVHTVRRDFPTIPVAVAEDMVLTLLPAESELMLETGRMPLRLNEAAVWQQREVRLIRALEGFHLESVRSPDTETLSLRLLDKLPGWSDQVRIEVRKYSTNGTLLDSIGNPKAPELKTLVKSNGHYQAFDAQGNELNAPSTGNKLCDSILHALPDGPRRALGFPHTSQGAQLKAALAALAASDRAQAHRLLGIRSIKLKFNSPKTMKVGRLGYSLSGNGRLPEYVHDDHSLDRLGLLGVDRVSAQKALAAMRNEDLSNADITARLNVLSDEHRALSASLDQWALASSEIPDGMSLARMEGRARIGDAIWRYWQTTSLFTTREISVALRLESVGLVDFPTQLPEFFHERIESLELIDAVPYIDPPSMSEFYQFQNSSPLERFLGRFTHVESLEISRVAVTHYRTPAFGGVLRTIATHLSRLRRLSLTNQDLVLTALELEPLNELGLLERLDLSGNSLTYFNPDSEFPIRRHLQYLGLDRTYLAQWPNWLNERLPEHISELSLNGNQIVVIPDWILSHRLNGPRQIVVSLLGNPLSRSAIIEARLAGARTGGLFNVNLDVPPEFHSRLEVLMREQTELETALRNWSEASGSGTTFNEGELQARRHTTETLLHHWSRTVAGRAPLNIEIELTPLSEFPALLPDTFYANVSSLALRNVVTDVEQLNEFLRRFRQIDSLDIVDLVPPLIAPPRALADFSNLEVLGLINHGMTIDQDAIDLLGSLPRLQHLGLSGNRLGLITDASVLGRHYWRSMTLDNMGLEEWPEWLTELIPANISSLSLCHNQIQELPAIVLENSRNDWAHTEISLEGNPLSRQAMITAHTGDHGSNRSFSFYMDLPEDIRSMPVNREDDEFSPDSDTDSDSDYPGHRHGVVGHGISGPPTVEPWLVGTAEQIAVHRQVWEQLETAADAPSLIGLINRLRESADFMRTRDALIPRVWYVLDAAAQDPELRALLNGMAQDEDIGNPTCADGIRLEFNQMEVRVYTRNSLRDIPDAERGRTLYQLMRRLYRLSEVDRLALANTRGRDEAEVRLAYRVGLAERLDLPLPPGNMLYRATAAVNFEELAGVQGNVMTSQNGDGLLDYAAGRDFWIAWLQETYAAEFTELQTAFEQEGSRLEDEFPELNDQYLSRAQALANQKEQQQRELIKRLTNREGLKYD